MNMRIMSFSSRGPAPAGSNKYHTTSYYGAASHVLDPNLDLNLNLNLNLNI
jgi:hypothetical protein